MLLIIASVCFAGSAGKVEQTHSVDVIEINHVIKEDGRESFVQAIYWRWYGNRLRVDHWRTVRPQHYIYCRGDGFADEWMSGGKRVVVRAKSYRETWTQYDPEIENRKCWPHELRRW